MSNLLVQNIKHTNNTTAMTVDSSGRVTQPVLPCWSVEGISGTLSNNGILNWANTNNGSDILSFVQGGVTWSGASDYKITVPVTGVYMVNVGINCRDIELPPKKNDDKVDNDLDDEIPF